MCPPLLQRGASKRDTRAVHVFLVLQGVAGSRPPASDLLSALQCHDLFLYFGHGAAEQCIPLAALRRLERCAASLLMGCSSGRLRPAGVYEPQGPVWAYVMAGGCMRSRRQRAYMH